MKSLLSMLRALVAASCAVHLGMRFRRSLAISSRDLWRYFSKNFALGLCYAAFVRPAKAWGFVRAGQAAFLCCAYDVVTDWRDFSVEYRRIFQEQLAEFVPEWACERAMELYWSDLKRKVGRDGLDRGIITVELITGVLGSKSYFSKFGVQRLGLLLQVVDDILDIEKDIEDGGLNFLKGGDAGRYLEFFMLNKQSLMDLFEKDIFMKLAINRAYVKADVVRSRLNL